MSERKQAARAELLRLIKRYVNPVQLGRESLQRLQDAVTELEDAAVEAHKVLHENNPAEAFAAGGQDGSAPAPVTGDHVAVVPTEQLPDANTVLNDEATNIDESEASDESQVDHPGDGQPHA